MALGKQFENTYYIGDDGQPKFYAPSSKGTPSESGAIGTEYQGMLFDPHWGTGTSKDPSLIRRDESGLLKSNEYSDVVDKALKLESGSVSPETRIDIHHALARTTLPVHLLNKGEFVTHLNAYMPEDTAGRMSRPALPPETFAKNDAEGTPRTGILSILPDWQARHGGTHTIVHEIGHGIEERLARESYPFGHLGRDPITEGVAEGFGDRFTSPRLDSDLRKLTPERIMEIDRGHGPGGYTWQHFKGKTAQALFAAVRYHASLHDTPGVGVPTRGELHVPEDMPMTDEHGEIPDSEMKKTILRSNQLVLGKMYDEHPHVRKYLEKAGYEDTAKKAHAVYLQRAARLAGKDRWEQQSFNFEGER